MNTIVLKDKANADVAFKLVQRTANNQLIYEEQSPSLIGRRRLTLRLAGNGAVNRPKAVLSLPTLTTVEAPGAPVGTVAYTNVGSFDFSVVKQSSLIDRENTLALFASLIASAEVAGLVVDGNNPV